MNYDLKAYAKVYKKVLTPSFCNKIIKGLENVNWEKHQFYNPNTDTLSNNKNELSVTCDSSGYVEELNKLVWETIEKYVLKDFKECKKWWNGWQGFTPVRFNKYEKGELMKLHCDHIHTAFDGERKGVPILSIVGVLNNNYTGGKFIMWQKEHIKIDQGDILIFPSTFMYPHEVTKIEDGCRYSFVSWTW